MTDPIFLSALRSAPEPTSHLLLECETILDNTDKDCHVCRLIGLALDRWNISKDELRTRNRLNVIQLNNYLEREPTLRVGVE